MKPPRRQKHGRWYRSGWAMVLLATAFVAGCALPLWNNSPGEPLDGEMSLENRYAGEVLAYMMRVVLGRAGTLAHHEEWRREGLGQPLDLDWIATTMDHPERPKSDLMVMDAGLIGLSEVLYDYNPRLNLFKGRYAFHSPYPSAELIALRLLLLGKLDRGETLRLSALMRYETDLVARGAALPVKRLSEMGLNAPEAALLQSVFRSEPIFRWYYKSPALVAAMDAMGLLSPEAAVTRRAGDYDYASWGKRPKAIGDSLVRIAVLPSLVPGFRSTAYGLQPPEDYVKTMVTLKEAIQTAVAGKLQVADSGETGAVGRLDIQLYLERPFVIHPLNAAHHLGRLCPDADLVILVLGRNVYRSIAFYPTEASSPQSSHWYLDLLDLKYGQTKAEIDEIATAAVAHLLTPDTPQPTGPISQGHDGKDNEAPENTI